MQSSMRQPYVLLIGKVDLFNKSSQNSLLFSLLTRNPNIISFSFVIIQEEWKQEQGGRVVWFAASGQRPLVFTVCPSTGGPSRVVSLDDGLWAGTWWPESISWEKPWYVIMVLDLRISCWCIVQKRWLFAEGNTCSASCIFCGSVDGYFVCSFLSYVSFRKRVVKQKI